MIHATSCGRASLVVISLSIGLLLANIASAQPQPPTLPARVDVCVPIDREEFQRLLANELATIVDSETAERKLRGAEVRLSCIDDVVEVALVDTVATTTRRVDLRKVAHPARTRLMALSVAELVFAQLHDARSAPASQQQPVSPTPQPPKPAEPPAQAQPKASEKRAEPEASDDEDDEVEEAEESESSDDEDDEVEEAEESESSDSELSEPWTHRAQLGAAGGVLAFSSTFEFVPNVALALSVPLSSAFALKIAAQLGFATLGGVVDVGPEPVPATVKLTIGSLLFALLRVIPLDAFDLVAGVGGRAGIAYFRGEQVEADVLPTKSSARWATALVTAGVGYRVARHMRIVASLEAGYVILRPRAVDAEDGVVTELRGLWTDASLGLAWAF